MHALDLANIVGPSMVLVSLPAVRAASHKLLQTFLTCRHLPGRTMRMSERHLERLMASDVVDHG